MRREFVLPERDRELLAALGLPWETVVSEGASWLLIAGRLLPPEYSPREVTTALRIESAYPDAQLDMVYFYPHLEARGRNIKSLASVSIDGRIFQRWSRHRSAENPWRPGVDDVATHLLLVDEWLRRELT